MLVHAHNEGTYMLRRLVWMAILLLFSLSVLAEDSIVATVNGVAIRSTELEQAIDRLIPRISFHGGVTAEKRAELRDRALEDLISRELRYQDALARGMKLDKGMVKEQMAAVRGQFQSKAEYEKALERSGMTENQLRGQVEKDVLVYQVTEKVVTETSRVSDGDLKTYYEKNRSKFKQPESVHLRVISMKDEEKAREAFKRVKSGEDFGNVAARMSEDNYRIMGGDIGYMHKGRLLPKVEEAAWKLSKGGIGGPMLSGDTWFILKVEDKVPEKMISFDDAKDALRKDLEGQRSKDIMEKWITDLKTKASINIVIKKQ